MIVFDLRGDATAPAREDRFGAHNGFGYGETEAFLQAPLHDDVRRRLGPVTGSAPVRYSHCRIRRRCPQLVHGSGRVSARARRTRA